MTTTRRVIGLLVFLAACFAAAAIGSAANVSAIPTWYAQLQKPAWNPPSWVFGPVWTVLYAAMAVAGWLVWKAQGSVRAAAGPLAIFTIQLVLNTAWSIVFFGQRQPMMAFVVIVLLWLSILATMLAFRRISTLAGWLFLPYLLWVTYASTLNYAIWQLNGA